MNESCLDRLRSGDPTAFEEVVRTYSARLLATASRILGGDRDAQDAVQDSLISAWKNIGTFQGTSGLYTWLHRITVNACLARLRAASAKSEVSISDGERPVSLAFEGLPVAWSEPSPSLEKRLIMRRSLQKALDMIPEEFRTVLILRDVEGLSSQEVADQLGVPDGTVRQRLHRARSAMAELLRPELCTGPELTCGGQLDLLLDYIDNALPSDLYPLVHGHIEGCEPCNSLLQTYRMTIGLPRAIAHSTEVGDVKDEWLAATLARARLPV
jgi:RNA polymerase sigma-70 factor (ECF subfamily)